MTGKWHETVNQNELCVFSGHLAKSCKNLGGISVGPVMHDLLEQEDRRVFDGLGRKEVVGYVDRISVRSIPNKFLQ